MKCTHVKVDGNHIIACGSRRLEVCACGVLAGFKCDWKIPGKSFRCDRDLCLDHSNAVGKNKHLCPEHWQAWQSHPANKQKDLFS